MHVFSIYVRTIEYAIYGWAGKILFICMLLVQLVLSVIIGHESGLCNIGLGMHWGL